jgi:hypothetical protein
MVNSMVNQFFGPVFDDFDYIVYTHILMHLPSHLQQVPPTMPVPHVPVLAFCPSKKSVDFAPKCLGFLCRSAPGRPVSAYLWLQDPQEREGKLAQVMGPGSMAEAAVTLESNDTDCGIFMYFCPSTKVGLVGSKIIKLITSTLW